MFATTAKNLVGKSFTTSKKNSSTGQYESRKVKVEKEVTQHGTAMYECKDLKDDTTFYAVKSIYDQQFLVKPTPVHNHHFKGAAIGSKQGKALK